MSENDKSPDKKPPRVRLNTYINEDDMKWLKHRTVDEDTNIVSESRAAIELYRAFHDGTPFTPAQKRMILARLAEEDE